MQVWLCALSTTTMAYWHVWTMLKISGHAPTGNSSSLLLVPNWTPAPLAALMPWIQRAEEEVWRRKQKARVSPRRWSTFRPITLCQIQGARKEIPMEVNVMEATCHCQVSTAVSCTESKILLIDWLIILEVCRDPEPGMAGATPNASEVVSWRQISKRIWLFSHWCEWDTPSLLASWLTFGKQPSGLAMQLPYIPPCHISPVIFVKRQTSL